MLFLNFMKVNNDPTGLAPVYLSSGKFQGIEVFVHLKERKRREKPCPKEEYPREPQVWSVPVRQRMGKGYI